jgi:hypothetical protein
VIDATMQPLRGGGLGLVHVGPAPLVDALLEQRRWLQLAAPAAYATGLLLIGGLAAALWWRQRDALYGCFSLASLFGMLRYVDPIWQPSPLPWPAWGALLAVGYACHLGFIARFVLLVLGRNPPWLVRTVHSVLAAAVVLGVASFVVNQPLLWTAALFGLEAMGAACLAVVAHEAWVRRRGIAWLVLGTGSLLVAAGLHDLLRVRLGLGPADSIVLTPHALFFCVLILAGIFVDRYNRTAADYRALNATLAERVAEREAQLREAFETLRLQRDEQATLAERQRIMREIHDGIGSQLVGLLNMVGDSDRGALEEQIRLALDEMRMAVDSLQPAHGDLTTVLATLRYRLQSRLQAARIEVVWDVAALPPVSTPSPTAALHLQRILLEAFTNVLKHARARRVTVQARWREAPAAVVLKLHDDGIGLPPAADTPRGHGLQNMQTRAQAIGAAVRVEAAAGGGTAVVIEWPMPGAAAQ